jgi:hypothetical protein
MNLKPLIPGMVSLVLTLPQAASAHERAKASTADGAQAEQQLAELKAMKNELLRTIRGFEKRIHKLETQVKERPAVAATSSAAATLVETPHGAPIALADAAAAPPAPPVESSSPNLFGSYEPGKGFVLARTQYGEVDTSVIAYLRYLNQTQINRSYTDSFGRTFTLDPRQDIQWNKVNLSFKGWLFDPDFTYRVWVWTQQPAMGEGAQVVVGGHLGYHFNDYFSLYGGIAPLPATRSLNWSYPFWLKMDNRTIADEFFRASYSQGIWAEGEIASGLKYRVMLANNLSALGIAAAQLDAQINTVSSFIWWMPTTGEFGPAAGFGDFEGHEKVATLFGVHYTRSREDKQSQPSTSDIENSQIRLSDGTLLFSPNAFNSGGQINRATYQMADLDAGIKYRGWSLEAEYYFRWVGDFDATGFIPVTSLFDHGFQVQASAMVIPRQLQAYVSGSEVFGQYGNPWDLTVGANWYPFDRREMHLNTEAIYLHHSPVGGVSYPYVVGGNGWIFNTDIIVTF